MDGNPNPKSKKWNGAMYSDTRYAVVKWLENELPNVVGEVLIVSAGNWPVPKSLLTNKGVKDIKTFDQKYYGTSKNNVDIIGDVHNMPANWTNKWDCIVNNQAIECYVNPIKAMEEMHRILKPGGVLLIDAPYNYRFFGKGSWLDPKQNANGVQDYWRITENGWQLLTKDFKQVKISGFGGTGAHDRFVYCIKAIK